MGWAEPAQMGYLDFVGALLEKPKVATGIRSPPGSSGRPIIATAALSRHYLRLVPEIPEGYEFYGAAATIRSYVKPFGGV